MARPSRNAALLEVIQGLWEAVAFRQDAAAPNAWASDPCMRHRAQGGVAVGGGAAVGHSINEIFRIDGPPTFTFVDLPQLLDLRLALRTMGTGLIVEGPSKVGKSTSIRKAMQDLGISGVDQIWWHGHRMPALSEFGHALDALLGASHDTWLFIDDFHRIDDERYRRELASAMKVLADQSVRRAKITLVGINPLGNSLAQVMPDLAGRLRVVHFEITRDCERNRQISELIARGEAAANIRFKRRDEFVVAAGGSFFLAQYLCNVAALRSRIFEAQPEPVEIELGPIDVIAALQGELSVHFHAPMLGFAKFDAALASPGAGLSLLWLLARSADGFVSVREARARFPALGAAFDCLQANLARCLEHCPDLDGLLHYDHATETLTMEDLALRFYLRALDWEEFAEASGYRRVSFHPVDGPSWPPAGRGSQAVGRGSSAVDAVGGGSRAFAPVPPTPAVAPAPDAPCRRLLHLSDLHFESREQATVWYSQLAADLREQQVDRLDALVVSGDVVHRADPAEYDAARRFFDKLMAGFALSPRQVALVPGNHDVSWSVSEEAYQLFRRSRYAGALAPGTYIDHDGGLIEVRDHDGYRKRFRPFAELYRAIKGKDYPLAYEDQATIDDLPDLGLCVLGLNSAWEIDHHFRDRARIHPETLANALVKLGAQAAGQLRIAVFHHPLHGGEDARIRDAGFLQQLAVHGFRLALHGHVHRADAELYRYDRTEDGRRIEIIAAGTFGAPVREWVPGYPLEYNLLLIAPDRVTVETRCRREVHGAWEPDARWRQGPGKDPLPRYVVER